MGRRQMVGWISARAAALKSFVYEGVFRCYTIESEYSRALPGALNDKEFERWN